MGVWRDILEAVQTTIQALNLSGVNDANVVIRTVATERGLTFPAVVIAPQRATINPRAGVLGSDDVQYGVLVAFLAADNQSTDNTELYTDWATAIMKAFVNKRLTGVASVYTCEALPADAVDRQGWDNNRLVGLQILRFTSREARG